MIFTKSVIYWPNCEEGDFLAEKARFFHPTIECVKIWLSFGTLVEMPGAVHLTNREVAEDAPVAADEPLEEVVHDNKRGEYKSLHEPFLSGDKKYEYVFHGEKESALEEQNKDAAVAGGSVHSVAGTG